MENPTVGYCFGMVEGYLEGRIAQQDDGAATVLEHLQFIEQAYKDKVDECLVLESTIETFRKKLQSLIED